MIEGRKCIEEFNNYRFISPFFAPICSRVFRLFVVCFKHCTGALEIKHELKDMEEERETDEERNEDGMKMRKETRKMCCSASLRDI